ncbi:MULTISPECIES: outer membrane protein [unclassified Mesorhizobium]|uniref:outer membrane protein n=1 Tax=unclassified Mesorhizobium TaxID=325217 RepID=UPI000FDC0CC6|nr:MULTISPECIES: outer membrane protein [unclassified Mesorhizobium]TGR38135.1 porin family protein [bacterium M00.F.Ca.ET.199.01.1.1]TGU26427.1 porin family protein [bacterium M00.F.Ca.ET.156.01.1.1]TGV83127.1 porin family protein [Mesorhizobium sp. M00.F.Ca.ET.149.01.1.1]TGR19401.1 porin family protein [Mesorhizobium sp. M8A.F.Ca.ET.202.01.1.1]TGR20907.1 porin family protein [Mesorhizobium sp. M8A.F.Ca.ET.197.01.1.1]
MKTLLLASTLLVAVSGSAFAADALVSEPVAYDWTGAYVGAQIGYGWGDVDSHDSEIGSGFSDWADSWNSNGVLGGIHLGYNQAFNSYVLGVEGDIEASGMSGSVDSDFAGTIKTKIDVQGSLRARLGYAMGPALLYATGGLAVAHFRTNYDDGGTTDSTSNTKAGWTVGAGVEYAFSQKWTTRVEYRYTDFGTFTDNPATDSGYNYPTDVKTQAVRVGISYKF